MSIQVCFIVCRWDLEGWEKVRDEVLSFRAIRIHVLLRVGLNLAYGDQESQVKESLLRFQP